MTLRRARRRRVGAAAAPGVCASAINDYLSACECVHPYPCPCVRVSVSMMFMSMCVCVCVYVYLCAYGLMFALAAGPNVGVIGSLHRCFNASLLRCVVALLRVRRWVRVRRWLRVCVCVDVCWFVCRRLRLRVHVHMLVRMLMRMLVRMLLCMLARVRMLGYSDVRASVRIGVHMCMHSRMHAYRCLHMDCVSLVHVGAAVRTALPVFGFRDVSVY